MSFGLVLIQLKNAVQRFVNAVSHFASAILHLINAILHFASAILRFASAVLHFASAVLHLLNAVLHLLNAVLHFANAVLRFVNALRQAFILGSTLGPALSALSQDVRKYRAARIEERIAKTPVKILAPLGLCIVPAVLILLMGPIMSQVLQGLQL